MKVVRYVAALLLLVSGILHALPFLKSIDEPHALPMLVFGIFYFFIGILLILNFRFAPMLGIIFPIIGLATGIFVIGILYWTMMLTFLFIIDTVVVICCIFYNIKTGKHIQTNQRDQPGH